MKQQLAEFTNCKFTFWSFFFHCSRASVIFNLFHLAIIPSVFFFSHKLLTGLRNAQTDQLKFHLLWEQASSLVCSTNLIGCPDPAARVEPAH